MRHALVISLSRSGGKLVRMLLDGHPDVSAIAFEHWNRTSKADFPARRIASFARLSATDKLKTAGAQHAERKLRRLFPQAQVDDFMQRWRQAAEHAATLAAMYAAFADSYAAVTGADPGALVVNHCGSLCRWSPAQLDAVYGEGRHLLTVRDPRAVYASMQVMRSRKFTIAHVRSAKVSATMLRRHLEKLEPVSGVSGYVREFCEEYRRMVSCHAARPDVVRVRFEDLVTAPETVMRGLAAQLGLAWSATLLEPTERGVPRTSNSSFGRQGVGIEPAAADRWVGHLDDPTRRHIEMTLAAEMDALGYQPIGVRA